MKKKMFLSLRKRINTAFIFAFLLLVIVGIASYTVTKQLTTNADSVTHTLVVLRSLDNMLNDANNAETGQRGYLLTNNEVYLNPYTIANNNIINDIKNSFSLTQDNKIQQDLLAQLNIVIGAKFAELKQTIDLRKQSGLEAALKIVNNNSGQNYMDQIRSLIFQLKDNENKLLNTRLNSFKDSFTQTLYTIASGILIALLTILATAILINRDIKNRAKLERILKESNERLSVLNIEQHKVSQLLMQKNLESEKSSKEIEKINNLMINRELKMIELKDQLKAFESENHLTQT